MSATPFNVFRQYACPIRYSCLWHLVDIHNTLSPSERVHVWLGEGQRAKSIFRTPNTYCNIYLPLYRFVICVSRYGGGVLSQFVNYNSPGKSRTVSIHTFGNPPRRGIWKRKKMREIYVRNIRKFRTDNSSVKTALILL